MKFRVDAQLPIRLAHFLNDAGHEAVHTSRLPNGNASTYAEVIVTADAQHRVVVTKDRDFRDGHLLSGSPQKLLVVATGNISNDVLLELFEGHLEPPREAMTTPTSSNCGPGFWSSIPGANPAAAERGPLTRRQSKPRLTDPREVAATEPIGLSGPARNLDT